MRLSGRTVVALFALVAIGILAIVQWVVPHPATPDQEIAGWLAGRATGITAYLLLTGQVVLGLVMSHPTNQQRWKLSRHLYPWHEDVAVFTLAFLAVHVVALVLDPFANIGLLGALVPGLSGYRPLPIALGIVALDALLITALTARYTRLLAAGAWLRIHRLAGVVWLAAWLHGVTAGTDSTALLPLYLLTGLPVVALSLYRYWVNRRATRPLAHLARHPITEEAA